MSPKCAKCKQSLQNKDVLKCLKCSNNYDTHCAGRPKLFLLMSNESKKSWTCSLCKRNKNSPSTVTSKKPSDVIVRSTITRKAKTDPPSTPKPSTSSLSATGESAASESLQVLSAINTPSLDNVTHRKPSRNKINLPIQDMSNTEISFESTQSEIGDGDTLLDSSNLNRSCPELGSRSEEELAEYKNKVICLELRLQSTENEIQNLIRENGSLKKRIEANEEAIKKLTLICTPTSKKEKSKTQRASIISSKRKAIKLRNEKNFDHDNTLEQALPVNNDISPSRSPTNRFNETRNSKENTENTESPTETAVTQRGDDAHDISQVKRQQPPKIYLFGGQQCVGLATKLHQMQRDSNIVKYNVSASIKPGANTESILEAVSHQKFLKDDKIVLSVGEHDSNPMDVLTSLHKTLITLRNNSVFILSVRESSDLDIDNLNYMLSRSCVSVNNLLFIDSMCMQNKFINKKKYLGKMCMKLILKIEQMDYKKAFYNYVETRNDSALDCARSLSILNEKNPVISNNLHTVSDKPPPQKGTIPYYFFRS